MTITPPTLSPEQRRALVAKLEKKGERRAFPLSFAQARLWILDRFQPGNPTYNIPAATRLQGWIDTDALQRAVNEIVRRHEALRTTFGVVDGKPAQVIDPELTVPLEVIDLRSLPRHRREQELSRITFEESRRSFDLARGPLLRAMLVQLDAADNMLMLAMHHIVSDGWSMGVLYNELTTLYTAYVSGKESPLPELPIQYADYAQWQADWLRGDVLKEQLRYWRGKLAGVRPVLDLPTDRPRPPVLTNRGDVRGFTLDRKLVEGLKTLSQANNATLFMTLMAAFKTLLHRLSGETDIAVGTPIANRTRSELEGLIGFFVNTLVLRTDLSGDPTFLDLLARERETALGAYAHQDMPFEKLVEELQPERDLAHNPLFQILFAVQNFGTIDRNAPSQPSGPPAPAGGNGTSKFDITMSVLDTGGGGQGFLEYNSDLFDAYTIELMIERYIALLRSIVEYPEWRLSQLPLTTPAERRQRATGWRGTPIRGPLIETMSEVIAKRATLSAQDCAVRAGDAELTYEELDRQANRVAHRLRERGAQPGARIAIVMTRGIDAIVAICGTLKAGCAYVPIDVSEPEGRVRQIVAATKPFAVLTDDSFRELALESASDEDPGVSILPETIASIVVRGDTRIPVTHRALCRAAFAEPIHIEPTDRVAHASLAASDRARYEIFGTLDGGGTIACLPEGPSAAPRKFAGLLRDLGITVVFAPASVAERLAREFPWALRKVRLLLNDERLTDATRLRDALRPEVLERMFSLWGDPEAGGYFLVQPLAAAPAAAMTVPMGSPVPNETIHVLDANLEPVPVGVPGDLYVESDLLARGGRLMASPFSDNLIFHTGDIARRLHDGSLEWRGRRDSRIFSGGCTVDAAELESALREHPAVRDAAVAQRRPQGVRERGLIAFIVSDDAIPEAELRAHLAPRFAEPLIPTAFAPIAAIPLLPDGTVNRRALADAAAAHDAPRPAQEPYVAPRNALETALTQIWMETLGVERIGIHDNFFRLGGHSLLATQAVARISDAYQIEIPLQRLFEAPTIEQLGKLIEPLVGTDVKPDILPIVRVSRDEPIPLSFAQQRLWFLDQFEPDSAFYNIHIPLRWRGPVDAAALEAALNDLVARHESLRTTFAALEGEPVQIIAPTLKVPLPLHDLRRMPEGERHAEAQRLNEAAAQRPFDLSRGPILRAELIRLSDNDHTLLFTIHHIAADGWSTDVIFRELFALYDARRNHRDASLPELRVQYADFACWQRKWLSGPVLERQIAYWKKHLDGAPPVLELPTDRPRPRVQTFSGGMYAFSIPASVLASAHSVSEREQSTLFTALLAAFYTLLYRYTGRGDLVVGTPIANRVRPELESLVGFFANTLVLRAQVDGTLTFRELMTRIREITLGAYSHQDIPFEKLVEELQPQRSLAYNPIFQVMFALQNIGQPMPVATTEPEDGTSVVGAGVAKFDLTMFVGETTQGLQVGIEYNSDLFDESTIVRLAGHYQALLDAGTTDPDRPLWSLPMLSSAESLALAEWTDTARPFDAVCVHQAFEAQVAERPDATALTFNGRMTTYAELNRRANHWAHRLIELGVTRDACVAVAMDRGEDLIVAVLAALKAGAAYVPVDPAYPKERIALMLRESRAPIVLTSNAMREHLPEGAAYALIVDRAEEQDGKENPATGVTLRNLAYVIFTSGSTGTPKGVAMPHGPLANLMQWQIRRSNLPAGARTLQFASLSFDVSFQEIFSTLCAGGSLVLIGEEERRDPRAVWNVLREANVNRLYLPYVALQQLAEEAKSMADLPSSLTEVITAGEQLQITPQIAALFERRHATLFNQYGPTESHVVTELELTGPSRQWPATPTIGRAIPNATIHILDAFGQPCAIGTPGELHIGTALARGYLHRPDLTAERFICDPQGSSGSRLYRTGDRARFLADGTIQFLGRVDDQMKIRGYRVEPGEVEGALRTHPAVREAAVAARPQLPTNELRLVAYVQADPRNAPTAQELRRHVAAMLPEHMIPSTFVIAGVLPLTPSGKLNRRALPDPELSQGDGAGVDPRTPVERAVAAIWCEVLQLPRVGVHDNFFELGGHSLLATRVVSRIRDEFGIELPVRRMFEGPTIEALALAIVESTMEAQNDDETMRLLAELEQMPDEEARTLMEE